MNRGLLMSIAGLLVLIVLLVCLSTSSASSTETAGDSILLAYVESSQGLTPPEMEGGRTEIEMGDVNGDGFLDLVSIGDHGSPYINTDQHGIMVWFGDGTGTWSVHQNGEFGYGGVALGDVNNDGLMDVGYGMHHNYSGWDFGDQLLEVALGDGTGQNWTPWDDGLAQNGEDWGMFGTDFADVDHDGDLDIGSISFGCCAGVHVYLNQGGGTWVQSFGFLGGNSHMLHEFGDVNGDGHSDFAVSHQNGTVYLGDGTGDFALDDGNLPPSGTRAGVSLGDVDNDGGADLAFCNDDGGVEVWSWVGPGTWQSLSGELPTSGAFEATQVFDMNMDGENDVAAFGDGQIRIWAGDGGGGWTEVASFSTPSPGYFQAFRVGGDADHNGFPDIVLVSEEGSWPSWQNHLRFYKETSTATELVVKPVYPRGYELLAPGTVVFVDWISAIPDAEPGVVTLEWSVQGPDGPWSLIADDLPNGGRFQWTVPLDAPFTEQGYLRYTLVVTPEIAQAITPAPFTILGIPDEPIEGLEASNDSPTLLGEATWLTATITAGTNVSYTWALGDGLAGEGETVTHVYPMVGAYTAVVTASNAANWLAATTAVTIADVPIAGLVASNDSPTALGSLTTLTATVAAGTNVSFTWTLGDGTVDTGAVISHAYPMVGSYQAAVTASNSANWMSVSTSVVVELPVRLYLPLVLRDGP